MKNNQLLIKKIEGKIENDGLIYTKEQGAQSWEGKVVHTCDSKEYPIDSVVIFYEKAGEDVIINHQKYIMLDKENVWCVVVEDN
jgi:co-chaperonin GroES (HSP10)